MFDNILETKTVGKAWLLNNMDFHSGLRTYGVCFALVLVFHENRVYLDNHWMPLRGQKCTMTNEKLCATLSEKTIVLSNHGGKIGYVYHNVVCSVVLEIRYGCSSLINEYILHEYLKAEINIVFIYGI